MSSQPFLSNFDHTCVICEEPCKPAPTERGWIDLPGLKGIHYDCLEHIWSAYEAMKETPEPGFTVKQVDKFIAVMNDLEKTNPPDPNILRYNQFDHGFENVIAILDKLDQLKNLADVAHKTVIAYEDWLGQAGTSQAARDSMWRLRQALMQAGYRHYDHDALDWRGSILKELNDAGFYPSTTDPYHAERPEFVYDPDAPQHGRIFGNAVGPTLKEILQEWKGRDKS